MPDGLRFHPCSGAAFALVAALALLVPTAPAAASFLKVAEMGAATGATANSSAAPALSTSGIGLPYAVGETATLLAGPHTNRVHACLGQSAPCNALDLVPASGVVRAAAAGTVHIFSYCQPGLVAIDHGPDAQGGHWWTGYYHLTAVSVTNGEHISQGQPIGRIGQTLPCGGTPGPGPHVHFFVKYVPAGASIGDIFRNTNVDVDLRNQTLAGWLITGEVGSVSAGGDTSCMTYVATGQKACAPSGHVTNYGATQSGPFADAILGELNRYFNGSTHTVVTGVPPAGFNYEATLGDLLLIPEPGTSLLYSCQSSVGQFTSLASNCEGQKVNGPLGYLYTSPPAGLSTQEIYRCRTASRDHFDSPDPNCEGQIVEGPLGYVIAYT